MAELIFPNKKRNLSILVKQDQGRWLMEQIPRISVSNPIHTTFGELENLFEEHTKGDFILFWNSPALKQMRINGLLML